MNEAVLEQKKRLSLRLRLIYPTQCIYLMQRIYLIVYLNGIIA